MTRHCEGRSSPSRACRPDILEVSDRRISSDAPGALGERRHRQRKIVVVAGTRDDGIKLLALHADLIAAFGKLDTVDVELLQKRADAGDVADLALFRENLA